MTDRRQRPYSSNPQWAGPTPPALLTIVALTSARGRADGELSSYGSSLRHLLDWIDPVPAQSVAPHSCDLLAAHPDDPGRVTAGVAFENIDAENAITACSAAVRDHPDVPRFYFQLGRAYRRSSRTPEAVRMYEQAAAANYLPAILNLIAIYEDENGGTGDVERALHWWRRAAEVGHAPAMVRVGEFFRDGVAVQRDFREAVRWFEAAVGLSQPYGQVELGEMYETGCGVGRDFEKAARLYRAAAETRMGIAQLRLGLLYRDGNGVECDGKTAAQWISRAAEGGFAKAQVVYGQLWERGIGVIVSVENAVSWYEKAAAAEDPDGLFHLGRMYHSKHGTPGVPDDRRLRMAFGLYLRAAELGQIEAQYVVGNIYRLGVDGMAKQDMEAARGWYRRAADKGHPIAGRILERLQSVNQRRSLGSFIDPVNKKPGLK